MIIELIQSKENRHAYDINKQYARITNLNLKFSSVTFTQYFFISEGEESNLV